MTIKSRVKIEKIVILSIVILFIFYGIFESFKLITGPRVTIVTPENGATLETNSVSIEGTAKNVSFISLNDRKIFVDDNGNFKEKLLLPYGYTIIKISAEDRFGEKIEKKIELWRPKENGNAYEEIKIEKISISTDATTTEKTSSTTSNKSKN